jgi:hypothetical protein
MRHINQNMSRILSTIKILATFPKKILRTSKSCFFVHVQFRSETSIATPISTTGWTEHVVRHTPDDRNCCFDARFDGPVNAQARGVCMEAVTWWRMACVFCRRRILQYLAAILLPMLPTLARGRTVFLTCSPPSALLPLLHLLAILVPPLPIRLLLAAIIFVRVHPFHLRLHQPVRFIRVEVNRSTLAYR